MSEQLRWKWLAIGRVASRCGMTTRWETISERHVQIARETGALGELPLALTQRVYVHLFAGELTTAASLVDEIRAATEATGSNLVPYGAVGLAALRGRELEAIPLIDETRTDVTRRGEGIGLSILDWALAVLVQRPRPLRAGSRGGASGRRASARCRHLELGHRRVDRGRASEPERPELAADARSRLAADGQDERDGLGPRGRRSLGGTVREDERAEELYVEAVDRLGRSRIAVDLARAHLLYGEWLRRQRRRLDARTQLRSAHDLFSDFGMEAFAERARVELEATGEHARRRTVDTLDQLTPQEAQISRLVAQGNRPTARSPLNCSSARARSSTTCARCSASSASRRARNWPSACWVRRGALVSQQLQTAGRGSSNPHEVALGGF